MALFWGLTFPLIREAMRDIDPFVFVAARFVAAALLFAPIVIFMRRPTWAEARVEIVAGLVCGVLVWASYLTQTIGLQTVPAGRAAFITASGVVMVPLMAPLFRVGRPAALDLGAAAVATLGLLLLTDPSTSGLSTGDLWILVCAVTYAAYIHVLQIALAQRYRDPTLLAFFQVAAVALCAVATLPFAGDVAGAVWSSAAVWAVVFCALVATIGTFLLQTRYQARTTATRTALLFSMEPVFAAVFAWVLLGELLGPWQLGGAALILGGIVGAELIVAYRYGSVKSG